MRMAPPSAMFICPEEQLLECQQLKHELSRDDLQIVHEAKLNDSAFIGSLLVGTKVVIDHAVKFTGQMQNDLAKFGMFVIRDVPPEQPVNQYVPPTQRKLIAEVISYRLGNTGLVIRDERGKQLCQLDMRSVSYDNGDQRIVAEKLVQELAALIEQRSHNTASVMDSHR